jgi:hypothetical protein
LSIPFFGADEGYAKTFIADFNPLFCRFADGDVDKGVRGFPSLFSFFEGKIDLAKFAFAVPRLNRNISIQNLMMAFVYDRGVAITQGTIQSRVAEESRRF